MSYKFTNSLRSSELCECNMAALNWCIFRKNRVVCQQRVPEFLTFGSHCSANFQPILDCFIPKFKLEYDDLENIKNKSCKCSRFQLTSNQTFKVFFGTPGRLRTAKTSLKHLNSFWNYVEKTQGKCPSPQGLMNKFGLTQLIKEPTRISITFFSDFSECTDNYL